MARVIRRFEASILACLIASGAAAEAASSPLQIEVTGGADSLGEIVFSFAEDGVEITQIPIAVPKGTPENAVARRIGKEFRRALPIDQYDVEVESGEIVLLSARGHSRRFTVRLVSNAVDGTQISIFRD